MEKAQLLEKQKMAEQEKAIAEGKSSDVQEMIGYEILAARTKVAELQRTLGEEQEEYAKTDAAVKESRDAINAYEQASTLILAGETEKAISLLNDYGNGFNDAADDVDDATKKELDTLRRKVETTSIQLGLLEAEYKEKQGSMTDTEKKEMETRIENAKTQAQDAREQYAIVGGDMVKGLVEGVEDADGNKSWNLAGKLKSLVERGIAAAKKAADEHSPSKKMHEVGAFMSIGAAQGAESKAKMAIDTMRKVAEGMIEATKDAVKNETPAVFKELDKLIEKDAKNKEKTVKKYNTEIEEITADHNKSLIELERKLIEDKKKKNADKAALEKTYNENVERLKQQHADKLEQIHNNINSLVVEKAKKLNELTQKYTDEAKKIWTDLETSIANTQKAYDDQLKSRTESIANSLGLWNFAEKNKVTGIELTKNLQSQIKVLGAYNDAIAKLEERNVDPEFIQALKELGVGSAGEVEAIAKMTDKQLDNYVSLWRDKTALAE